MVNLLLTQYEQDYVFYQSATNSALYLLTELLNQRNFNIHLISGRTKSQASLAAKIQKSNHKYRDLSEITDLCGIRIITCYEDEIDQIAALIKTHFSIDETNSVDKRKLLKAESFGYTSLHLILEIPVARPEDCAIIKCKIELQIRSILQHAWAEIEHDLVYKNKGSVTYATRRQFSRLASLLEFADAEFLRLRETRPAKKSFALSLHSLSTKIRLPYPSFLSALHIRQPKTYSNLPLAASYMVMASAIISVASILYFGKQLAYYAALLSSLLTNV